MKSLRPGLTLTGYSGLDSLMKRTYIHTHTHTHSDIRTHMGSERTSAIQRHSSSVSEVSSTKQRQPSPSPPTWPCTFSTICLSKCRFYPLNQDHPNLKISSLHRFSSSLSAAGEVETKVSWVIHLVQVGNIN